MATLLLVPTPVGNLEDITLRAIEAIRRADIIICEDTRSTARLLRHLNINEKRMYSFHVANEKKVLSKIVSMIASVDNSIYMSEAGTPGISDPGFLLVRECLKHHIHISCLPGPTAFVPALVISGFPTHHFYFEGFLPHRKGREKRLQFLASLHNETIILYESPHRLTKTLQQLAKYFGENHPISISRELSKWHEETLRGTLQEMMQHFNTNPPRGEFVLILGPKNYSQTEISY